MSLSYVQRASRRINRGVSLLIAGLLSIAFLSSPARAQSAYAGNYTGTFSAQGSGFSTSGTLALQVASTGAATGYSLNSGDNFRVSYSGTVSSTGQVRLSGRFFDDEWNTVTVTGSLVTATSGGVTGSGSILVTWSTGSQSGTWRLSAPALTYLVSGRVANRAGVAIPNVRISRSIRGTASGSVLTNSLGRYTFTNTAGVPYNFTASAPGVTFSPVGSLVYFPRGQQRNATVNFTAISFGISGRVVNSAGTGVANVRVSRSGSSTAALTNSRGVYTFNNVPAGNYTVSPVLTGFTFIPRSRSVPVATTSVSVPNFVATRVTTTAALSTTTAPAVTLSTTVASTSLGTLQLTFTGALDAEPAGDPAHYTVEVNEAVVAVESAAYNAVTHGVTLGLPEGALHGGDTVALQCHGLLDARGAAVIGQSGPLPAR